MKVSGKKCSVLHQLEAQARIASELDDCTSLFTGPLDSYFFTLTKASKLFFSALLSHYSKTLEKPLLNPLHLMLQFILYNLYQIYLSLHLPVIKALIIFPLPGLPTPFLSIIQTFSSLSVPAQMPSSLTRIWHQYELMAVFGKHDLLCSYLSFYILVFSLPNYLGGKLKTKTVSNYWYTV